MGLMEVDGNPYVIEYNVRLGDPETQTILPLIESDFLAMINSAIEGKLDEYQLTIKQMHSVTIVCASGGYPESFTVHHSISLPQTDENCNIFHAGTIFHANNNTVLTNGGRVLAVNATAPTLQQAQRDALECVKKIDYEKKYFREDIGLIF
jgi:phosphoribosylamine--glycine ligase